ncbi:Proteinase K [Psilocybe cubensis]|uniref:Proteinase K n=1 Tax=Psilocybe cubensis TaxID=181762 RepID=A0ACB8GPU9_PSICU|nr:Proteinase K [Psilocybe cubensis]KAH9477251.1 Proteinase K [Psilocybe cubensis]
MSSTVNSETQTYIVVLKDGISTQTFLASLHAHSESFKTFSADAVHTYEDVLNGFCGTFNQNQAEAFEAHPDVKYIEKDAVGEIFAQQNNAPWGLGRLSRISPFPISTKPLPNKFFYFYDYPAGKGVDIYIVDTGIDTSHPSFEKRALWGKTFAGTPNKDLNGHGTHVAGTAISKLYGVAKTATAIAVKIGDDGIRALDWIISSVRNTKRPSVVNLSIGAAQSRAIDDSVEKLFRAKIPVVAAAGNSNKDAKTISPARSPFAITVGASNIQDKRYTLSNYGSVVNVFAPGSTTYIWPPRVFDFTGIKYTFKLLGQKTVEGEADDNSTCTEDAPDNTKHDVIGEA